MVKTESAELNEKTRALRQNVASLGKVLVAYSGGVDSTLLLRVCADVLGPSNVLAVTATSETLPAHEEQEARRFAAAMGVEHLIVPISELEDECFVNNTPDRCYYCKRVRYGQLLNLAGERGIKWVLDGSNREDLGDYRPGMRAARELGVRSPLQEAGLSKDDIRQLSLAYDLPTWDKPSYACLSSRVPYGSRITAEKLAQIDAAECCLRNLGFRQVRVRHHGDVARIEVPPDQMVTLLANGAVPKVVARLKELGFTYVALDLQGYRTGSMNETIS